MKYLSLALTLALHFAVAYTSFLREKFLGIPLTYLGCLIVSMVLIVAGSSEKIRAIGWGLSIGSFISLTLVVLMFVVC